MNCWRWFSLFALTALTTVARADGRSEVARPCDAAPRVGALGQLSCELIKGLPALEGELLVVAVNLTEAKDAAGDELSQNLALQLAADLAPKARAQRQVMTPATAAALARRGLYVALIESKLSRERLTATLSVVRPQKFWQRFGNSELSVAWRSQATRAIDSELRQYLPVVPLVVSRIDRAAPLDEPILALGCGDVDGDGSLEIVGVGRRRVQVGRVVRGRFSVLASTAWTELSEIAPRPLREPIATASVLPGGGVVVGLSDRADGLRLGDQLQVVERYPDRLVPCAGRDPKPTPSTRAIDAFAGLSLARRDGTAHTLLATRGVDGTVELGWGARRVKLDAVSGAQLALGELNGDGRAELLTTVDTLDPAQDALIVHSLDDAGAAKPGFRVPVPSGIRALAVCPSEGRALTPIVLATGDGLWVVR